MAKHPIAQNERQLELEEAMQDGYNRLMDDAVRAGWTRAEATRAPIALVD